MGTQTMEGSGTNDDKNLRSVLSSDEQHKLILLVENISLVMRKQISEIFDVTDEGDKKPIQARSQNDQKNNQVKSLGEMDRDHKIPTHEEKSNIKKKSDVLPKLKQDYLQFFDAWKNSIISKISMEVEDSEKKILEVMEDALPEGILAATDDTEAKVIREPLYASRIILKIHKLMFTVPSDDIVEADAKLIELYPPVSTPLCSLPYQRRLLILHVMLLMLLSLKKYSAPSRVLLLYISSSLQLPLRVFVQDELEIAQSLLETAKKMSGADEMKIRSEMNKFSRAWKVGLASVAGAAIIGFTGGLAAPLVAGAIGTIMGGLGLGATAAAGLLGAVAESSVVVGSLFGAYGARMTGNAIDSYAKDVNDFAFLPLKSSNGQSTSSEDHRLRVTVGISGWLTREDDIIAPWRSLGQNSEVFALRWELEALNELGCSLESVVKSAAWGLAKKEIITRTIFATISQALWPLALLKVAKVVDNPFTVCMSRADKAGIILADAIINKAQGERPITLIGYSLGARLIYSCLLSLCKRRAFGLVENVVLMGTPVPSQETVWRSMRSVVSGRLVNVYSKNDYILAFLYRTSKVQYGVAGIQQINGVRRIENFDASEIVSGHLRYQFVVGSILERIGWENVNLQEVSRVEETLELLEKNEQAEQGTSETSTTDGTEVSKKISMIPNAHEK